MTFFFWRSTSGQWQNLTFKNKKGHHEDKIMWSKFAEVQCAFAVAEVRKVTANLSQTCGFAVAEWSVNLRCPALIVSR